MNVAFAFQFFVAAAALATPALGGEEFDFRFEVLGKRYQVSASKETLKNSIWDTQTEENPPVSARKAKKLADKVRESIAKDDDDRKWKLSSLDLHPFGEKWVWLVSYQAFSNGHPRKERIVVVVLMDGTVVKTKMDKEKGRRTTPGVAGIAEEWAK